MVGASILLQSGGKYDEYRLHKGKLLAYDQAQRIFEALSAALPQDSFNEYILT
jgi:hypothetical protein